MSARVLDKLKRGQLDDEFRVQIDAWRESVLKGVGSMQFDSIEEVEEFLGLPAHWQYLYIFCSAPCWLGGWAASGELVTPLIINV